MNRNTASHEIAVDENADSSEFRPKLSNAGWKFLRVAVVGGRALAHFEEQTSPNGSNCSFFLYRDDTAIRCRADYEWLDTFVVGESAFHLYGHRTSDKRG